MAAAKRFVAAFEQNRVARRPGWKKKTSPIELSFKKEAETKRRRKDRIWIDRRIDVTDPVEIAIEERRRGIATRRGGWEPRPRTRGPLGR